MRKRHFDIYLIIFDLAAILAPAHNFWCQPPYLTNAAVYPMNGPHAIMNRIQRGSQNE